MWPERGRPREKMIQKYDLEEIESGEMEREGKEKEDSGCRKMYGLVWWLMPLLPAPERQEARGQPGLRSSRTAFPFSDSVSKKKKESKQAQGLEKGGWRWAMKRAEPRGKKRQARPGKCWRL